MGGGSFGEEAAVGIQGKSLSRQGSFVVLTEFCFFHMHLLFCVSISIL